MKIFELLVTYRFSRYYKIGFLVWDVLMLNLAILGSYCIVNSGLPSSFSSEDREISLLSNVFWIMLLLYKDSYRLVRTERIESILYRTVRILLFHIAIIATVILVLGIIEVSGVRLLYFYAIFFVLLVCFRIFFMKLLKFVRAKGYNFRRVIIVGANAMGERMNRILTKDLTYGYKVLGFFDDQTDGTVLKAPLLGNLDAISTFLENYRPKIDEMYVSLHIDKIETINKLTLLCDRHLVRIRYVPDFQQYTKTNRVQVAFYGNGNIPVLMRRKEPLEVTVNRIIKKIFDFCFSLFVIVFIFSWLFPIIILCIKLNSKGPIFFVQMRSGRDNQAFPCYKFRTMYVNKEANVAQASKNDARITKVGAFLRRTSLDEMPQFLNVLVGNMSVVGPRPHMLSHTEQYSNLIDNFLVRHFAKPGITGWAQVNGYRGETKELSDMEGRVEHDIWYIENWSFLLDLRIIVKTVLNVFRGEKNAF